MGLKVYLLDGRPRTRGESAVIAEVDVEAGTENYGAASSLSPTVVMWR